MPQSAHHRKLNAIAAHVATGAHREAILASALSVGPRSEGSPVDREHRMLVGSSSSTNSDCGGMAEGHELRFLLNCPITSRSPPKPIHRLMACLARFVWKTGVDVYQPPLITLTYEFPSALQLRAIRRVFRSPIASSYGSTEAGYVFMECEHGRSTRMPSSAVWTLPLLRTAWEPMRVSAVSSLRPLEMRGSHSCDSTSVTSFALHPDPAPAAGTLV